MKNVFDRLTNRISMSEKRISDLKDMSMDKSQTKMQREKNKTQNKQNTTKGEGQKAEEIFQVIMAESFPKLMTDTKPQIIEPQISTD